MKKNKVFLAAAVVVGLGAVGFAAKYFTCGACKNKRQTLSQEQKFSLASELVRIAREEPETALREWLTKQNPWVSGQAILALDNRNDPASRARLAAMNTIYSLDSENLSDEARKGWAMVLRDLANSMFHPGDMRTDFVAKSYIMEGRTKEAAAQYSLIPHHPSARLFFGENPDLRSPASNSK